MLAGAVVGRQRESRHAGNRRQRFAAKSERAHAREIIELADLRRGVAFDGEQRVVVRHSASVVAHFDPFAAAVFEDDVDRARAGVDRVFDQLFHDRRGPFHDLSGGDLIHQFRREHTNRGHEAFYLLASPAWLAESVHFSASSSCSRSCSC